MVTRSRIVACEWITQSSPMTVGVPAFGAASGCYFRVAYGALQKATVAEGIGRLVTGLRKILV